MSHTTNCDFCGLAVAWDNGGALHMFVRNGLINPYGGGPLDTYDLDLCRWCAEKVVNTVQAMRQGANAQ